MEEMIVEYLRPELLILIPVLYFIGLGIKKIEVIKDNYIPLILGGIGIIFATAYTCISAGFGILSILTGICQGALCAAGSVYANQIYQQLKKKE